VSLLALDFFLLSAYNTPKIRKDALNGKPINMTFSLNLLLLPRFSSSKYWFFSANHAAPKQLQEIQKPSHRSRLNYFPG